MALPSSSSTTGVHNLSPLVSQMSISSIGGSAESNNSTPEGMIQHTLTNLHLERSQIINLHKLRDAIRTITQNSAACKSPVELIEK